MANSADQVFFLCRKGFISDLNDFIDSKTSKDVLDIVYEAFSAVEYELAMEIHQELFSQLKKKYHSTIRFV